jgi:branched-chain amino acid transport system substrate-binding protein
MCGFVGLFRGAIVAVACIVLSLRAFGGEEVAAPQAGELLLGMSTALTGPAADLGLNMRAGVLAALEEANRGGGIGGQRLRLLSLDDAYEPARTIPNMRKLVDDPRVLAVVGNVGTPTAIAAIPIAIEGRMPFYGAFTGAGVLRKSPPDHYVINYRASYAEETSAMVDALIEQGKLKPTEIAFFTQRDAYGDAGFAGAIAALKRHGLADEHHVPHVRYERNTGAVERAVGDLLLLPKAPRAVIMVGAYAPCAAFIKLARQNELDALMLNVSFVGSEPLAKAAGAQGEGTIITQTVPHYEADLPIAREYRAAMKQLDAALPTTFGSMEGYVSTRLLLAALRKAPTTTQALTRESVAQALEQVGKIDLGLGAEIELSPARHQACQVVWPTIIRGGRVVPFRWVELSATAAAAAEARRP